MLDAPVGAVNRDLHYMQAVFSYCLCLVQNTMHTDIASVHLAVLCTGFLFAAAGGQV